MAIFQDASGFSASWIHFLMIMIAGVVVAIIGAALIGCLVHKLNGSVFQKGAELIIYMLLIAMIVTIFLGVLKAM